MDMIEKETTVDLIEMCWYLVCRNINNIDDVISETGHAPSQDEGDLMMCVFEDTLPHSQNYGSNIESWFEKAESCVCVCWSYFLTWRGSG